MDLLSENKLRNFIRNAFGVVKKPFDIKEFSKELMELAPLIKSVEIDTKPHAYLLYTNKGAEMHIYFDDDGTIAYSSGFAKCSYASQIQCGRIYSFVEKWSKNSITTKNSDKAEIIFKTFMNWFNNKKEKPIKENESNKSSGKLDVKAFSEGLMKLSKYISSVERVGLNEYEDINGYRTERINFLINTIDKGDVLVSFIGDGLYTTMVYSIPSKQARKITRFLNKYATTSVADFNNPAKPLKSLFATFTNLINSKNKKRIDESIKDKSNSLTDFCNAIKNLYSDITRIEEKSKSEAYRNSEYNFMSSTYVVKMKDGGDATLFFNANGSFNGVLTGHITPLVTKLYNLLEPYAILSSETNEYNQNTEIIFKTFMNAVNNNKQINEVSSLDSKKQFDVKEVAYELMKLKDDIKSIDTYYGRAYKTNLLDGHKYVVWIGLNAGIIIYFDRDGRLLMTGFDYPNYNTELQEEMFRFHQMFYAIANKHTNKSGNEKMLIVFKTFANYINSKNKKSIDENMVSEKYDSNMLVDFNNALKSIYNDAVSITEKHKASSIYSMVMADGGGLSVFFKPDGGYNGILTGERTVLVKKAENILLPFNKYIAINAPSKDTNVETIFKSFMNSVNNKKQINENNSTKEFDVKEFASVLMRYKDDIKSIEKIFDSTSKIQRCYRINTKENSYVEVYFRLNGSVISIYSGSEHIGEVSKYALHIVAGIENFLYEQKRKLGREKSEIVFKAFVNYINSRNNKKIEENIVPTDNKQHRLLKLLLRYFTRIEIAKNGKMFSGFEGEMPTHKILFNDGSEIVIAYKNGKLSEIRNVSNERIAGGKGYNYAKNFIDEFNEIKYSGNEDDKEHLDKFVNAINPQHNKQTFKQK